MADCTTLPRIPATRVDLHAGCRDTSAMPPRTPAEGTTATDPAARVRLRWTQYPDAVFRLHDARMS